MGAPEEAIDLYKEFDGADGVYAEAERAQVLRAARLMGVPDDIVLSLHALVDMERAVGDLRAALFHVNSV
ncbi:hypothetical protein [Streptomyces sp. CMSTAAHL-2]|uniref:hypothetical protein n=1 Tax=Streptomyces sp. CMSTAAHL-2 TaxID=2904522 RepID=UPI001E4D3B82|nr:hypothetical protein [Streptomyces sp. CMSTAAHL-2]MCE3029797.1 hypothetical protein [Streptomyces sp. CMSTAAHL-2]